MCSNFRLLSILIAFLFSAHVRANDIIPQTLDSRTTFDRVVDLYNKGQMPDWADFDPNSAPNGDVIRRSNPDNLLEAQMISLESGNVVVGRMRRIDFFPRSLNGQPFTIKMGQDCIANRGIPDCVEDLSSPLVANSEHNAFIRSTVRSEGACASILRVRKVLLSDNVKALIGVTIENDLDHTCNPDYYGARFGEVSTVAYVILP